MRCGRRAAKSWDGFLRAARAKPRRSVSDYLMDSPEPDGVFMEGSSCSARRTRAGASSVNLKERPSDRLIGTYSCFTCGGRSGRTRRRSKCSRGLWQQRTPDRKRSPTMQERGRATAKSWRDTETDGTVYRWKRSPLAAIPHQCGAGGALPAHARTPRSLSSHDCDYSTYRGPRRATSSKIHGFTQSACPIPMMNEVSNVEQERLYRR